MRTKRVVLASPSTISRSLIGRLLGTVPGIEVVGEAVGIGDALALVGSARPDLAVVAASLAGSREFEALRSALGQVQARWIEISGIQPNPEAPEPARDARNLPILSHGLSPDRAGAAIDEVMAAPPPPRPAAGQESAREPTPAAPAFAEGRFIVMGASTGGVDALLRILSEFPADCPPTAIVQHTGKAHSESLVQLLGRNCRAKVVAPRDGMEIRSGMICVAAGGGEHLRIRAGTALRCGLRAGEPVSGHLPSVDALFLSAAPAGARAVGVILTGMGRDGADGLLGMRRAGAFTIGQDEATSLVYGMPRAAWEIGAVETRQPLAGIARTALRACQEGVAR